MTVGAALLEIQHSCANFLCFRTHMIQTSHKWRLDPAKKFETEILDFPPLELCYYSCHIHRGCLCLLPAHGNMIKNSECDCEKSGETFVVISAQFLLVDSLWKWMDSSDWLLSVITQKRSTFVLICAQFLLVDSLWKWTGSSDWLLCLIAQKRSTFVLISAIRIGWFTLKVNGLFWLANEHHYAKNAQRLLQMMSVFFP